MILTDLATEKASAEARLKEADSELIPEALLQGPTAWDMIAGTLAAVQGSGLAAGISMQGAKAMEDCLMKLAMTVVFPISEQTQTSPFSSFFISHLPRVSLRRRLHLSQNRQRQHHFSQG